MALWILVNIGSGNGLSPVRHQAITWTNVDLFTIEHFGANLVRNVLTITSKSLLSMHGNCWVKTIELFCQEEAFENGVCLSNIILYQWVWSKTMEPPPPPYTLNDKTSEIQVLQSLNSLTPEKF